MGQVPFFWIPASPTDMEDSKGSEGGQIAL
jgi:hypothetical protein